MELSGDTRTYLVVNTTEYNGGTKWYAQDLRFNELPDVGFDEDDMRVIEGLPIGGTFGEFDHLGVIIVRVA